MKLTARNMANVDTPGYKTQGFDFEQEFARQLNDGAGAAGLEGAQVSAEDVDGLVARPDGNNVSMDREGCAAGEGAAAVQAGRAAFEERVLDGDECNSYGLEVSDESLWSDGCECSALKAERVRAEVVASNMANAETTRTPEGGPYQRHHVVFEAGATADFRIRW